MEKGYNLICFDQYYKPKIWGLTYPFTTNYILSLVKELKIKMQLSLAAVGPVFGNPRNNPSYNT